MGQYKISVEFVLFIGFGIYYMPEAGIRSIKIFIPFMCIYLGLENEARGVRIFNKEF